MDYDILLSKQYDVANRKLELLTPTNELLKVVNVTTTRHTGGYILTRSGGFADQPDANMDKSIVSYAGFENNTRTGGGEATKRQRARNESHNTRRFPNLHSSSK